MDEAIDLAVRRVTVDNCPSAYQRQLRRKWILRGKPLSVLWQLSAPMLLAILALFSADIVELYFAARVGHNELTALSFTLPLQLAFSALAVALGIVIATRTSQLLGANRCSEIPPYLRGFLSSVVILSLALAALVAVFMKPCLMVLGLNQLDLGQAGAMLALIEPYLTIRLMTLVFFLLVWTVFGMLRALGNMAGASRLLLIFSLSQIVISTVLFGVRSEIDLPVSGLSLLALSHGASAFLACVYGVYILQCHERLSVLTWRASGTMIGFSLGHFMTKLFPVLSVQLMLPLASALLLIIVAGQGAEAVAAFGVILRIEPLALLLPMVLTTSLPIFVGQNWAAQYKARIRSGLLVAALAALIWQLLVAVFLYFSAQAIGESFCHQQRISEYIAQALKILPISYAALAIVMLYVSSCNAQDQVRRAIWVSGVRLFALMLPMAWLGGQWAGYMGILVALALSNVIMGAYLIYKMLSSKSHEQTTKQAAKQATGLTAS